MCKSREESTSIYLPLNASGCVTCPTKFEYIPLLRIEVSVSQAPVEKYALFSF
jgi:hypothetical protein